MKTSLISIGNLAKATGFSITQLRRLADEGSIPTELTAGGQRRFELELVVAALQKRESKKKKNLRAKKSLQKKYKLANLKEDLVWDEVAKELNLSKTNPAWDLAPYAFTEMLNNAIDHSGGESVQVTVSINEIFWNFCISDDGIGVFKNIRESFGLSQDLEAVGELTKGKRTTAPESHTGEGIFFTSKLVDTFRISANKLEWLVDNDLKDNAIGPSEINIGTTVVWSISTTTSRTFLKIAQLYTENYEFTKSAPVIKLFEIGVEFVSRSEAKRLLVGLDKFSEIIFDYKGVTKVGQGFIDEIYRVWKLQHPTTTLTNRSTSAEVNFMIKRGGG